jgi:hypothetical protein
MQGAEQAGMRGRGGEGAGEPHFFLSMSGMDLELSARSTMTCRGAGRRASGQPHPNRRISSHVLAANGARLP